MKKKVLFGRTLLIGLGILILVPQPLFGKRKGVSARRITHTRTVDAIRAITRSRSPASFRPAEAQKPLEVTGQTRNLSMMLVIQNSKNKLKFVNARHNYSDQIPNTRY